MLRHAPFVFRPKFDIFKAGMKINLTINGKKYSYSSFKSFSLLRDGDMTSVNFFPLKRFMPLVSAYLAQADEDKVAKAIGNHLPYEQRQMDSIDRLSRRLRF